MPTPIKIIVETIASERDRNGNCYTFARFYLPSKGRSAALVAHVDGESNARSIAYNAAGKDWETVLAFESTIPKREWTEAAKGAHYDSMADATAILAEALRVGSEGGAL